MGGACVHNDAILGEEEEEETGEGEGIEEEAVGETGEEGHFKGSLTSPRLRHFQVCCFWYQDGMQCSHSFVFDTNFLQQ